jgi:hypothetical protein
MAQAGLSAIRSAFGNQKFWRYVSGNILSHFGGWIQGIAMGWVVWELTGVGILVGSSGRCLGRHGPVGARHGRLVSRHHLARQHALDAGAGSD